MKVAKKTGIKIFSLGCLISFSISTMYAFDTSVQIQKDSIIYPAIEELFKSNMSTEIKEKHRLTYFDAGLLPVFCKIEHMIEHKSKIPFRFRLGNLNYVNMLENKE